MRFLSTAIALLCHLALFAGLAVARPWSDKSGEYELDADLISFDDEFVILRRADKELAALEIAQLSDDDRKYLESTEAKDAKTKSFAASQEVDLAGGASRQGEGR